MPFLVTIGWSWITSIGGGIISKIPWQVWAAIVGVLALMYYGHVREKRGYDRCTAQVRAATGAEMLKRAKAAEDSAQEALNNAAESAERARTLQGELDATQVEVAKLKNAKTVCIPKSITDRYQRGRVRGQ